jgi:hypothetical protein
MARTLSTLLAVCLLACGCTRAGWQAWKTDCYDTMKAMAGNGEYLGASTEARDVERSLDSHRTRPIVER